jgi:hypothetical protein
MHIFPTVSLRQHNRAGAVWHAPQDDSFDYKFVGGCQFSSDNIEFIFNINLLQYIIEDMNIGK